MDCNYELIQYSARFSVEHGLTKDDAIEMYHNVGLFAGIDWSSDETMEHDFRAVGFWHDKYTKDKD